VLDLSPVISLLFIGAMLVLIVGLLMFLREVHLATQTMKSGMQLTLEEE
jgi:flagellar biosynthesis protein FliR